MGKNITFKSIVFFLEMRVRFGPVGTVQLGTERYSLVRNSTVQLDTERYGSVLYGDASVINSIEILY